MLNHKSQHKKNKKELNPLYTYMKQTDQNRKKEYEHFLEHECEKLDIPKEVLGGQPFIRMAGNHSMSLSGTYSIETYSTESISLQIKKQKMVVTGERLSIQYFRQDEIKITGNILNISFCK